MDYRHGRQHADLSKLETTKKIQIESLKWFVALVVWDVSWGREWETDLDRRSYFAMEANDNRSASFQERVVGGHKFDPKNYPRELQTVGGSRRRRGVDMTTIPRCGDVVTRSRRHQMEPCGMMNSSSWWQVAPIAISTAGTLIASPTCSVSKNTRICGWAGLEDFREMLEDSHSWIIRIRDLQVDGPVDWLVWFEDDVFVRNMFLRLRKKWRICWLEGERSSEGQVCHENLPNHSSLSRGWCLIRRHSMAFSWRAVWSMQSNVTDWSRIRYQCWLRSQVEEKNPWTLGL